MLKNYTENILLPNLKDARKAAQQMVMAIDSMILSPDSQSLSRAQTAWMAAFTEWQWASIFNVGPAAEQGLNKALVQELATFPVSEAKLNDAIINGTYNINDFNRDARGYMAIEYMLFGGIQISAADILTLFNTQTHRKKYLKECGLHIQNKLDKVIQDWENGMLTTFNANQGTDAGSSTSQLYNEFVKSFETNKNLKLELPMGLRPGQTQSEPNLTEAYYSGKSIYFLKTHLKAIEYLYEGKTKLGADGIGFKDYLAEVTGGPELATLSQQQWNQVIMAQNAISDLTPLSELIKANSSEVAQLRIELQKQTRYFKSDMSSVLGISITYSSGDGD